MARDYQVYEKTVGEATPSPRQVWGIDCVIECDCPHCPEGKHRVDAFNRGSHKGWYETRQEAEQAIRGIR